MAIVSFKTIFSANALDFAAALYARLELEPQFLKKNSYSSYLKYKQIGYSNRYLEEGISHFSGKLSAGIKSWHQF